MSEYLHHWIDDQIAEADLMLQEGSYDGEDYWRGASDILMALKNKINSGEIRLA